MMRADAPDADADLQLHVMLDDDDGTVVIFHDRVFSAPLLWLEFDQASGLIDFVFEGGGVKNWGIPVDPEFARVLCTSSTVVVIRRQGTVAIEGEEYPLVVHDRSK